MKYLKFALLFLFLLISDAFAWNQKPIILIVPFSVGGATDVLARHIEHAVELTSNLRVVVINQGGASGNIGMRSFTKYDRAMLLTTENIFLNKKYLTDSYPHDILNSLTPIYFFGNSPYVVFAHKNFKDFHHLVAVSKQREIIIGTAAPGSGSFESYNLLCNQYKIFAKCRRVSYKSGSDAALDLMAGRIDVYHSLFSAYQTFTGLNTVNALAVLSKHRAAFLPHVASTFELGYNIENHNWHGLFHKGLSQNEIATLQKSINGYFDKNKLLSLGYETILQTLDEFWQEKLVSNLYDSK
jgi:tripartite-type tricarboxylate transporter receptor subunit TctC